MMSEIWLIIKGNTGLGLEKNFYNHEFPSPILIVGFIGLTAVLSKGKKILMKLLFLMKPNCLMGF